MKKSILICLLATGLISCKKYLGTVPKDFLTTDNYYQTSDELNAALTGVYDILTSQNLYGQGWYNQINGGTDIEYWRNNGTSPTTTSPRIYNENSSDTWVGGAWNDLYTGISRANSIIDNVDKSPVDSATKSRVEGQALFLRGYFYFLLVSNWGGVPLRMHTAEGIGDIPIPKSTPEEVYTQVLKDLTRADSLLPQISYWGSNGTGRASKTAAEGILARVCLTMAGAPLHDESKYQDAKNWALKVINSGQHSLNPDYRQIFINECEDLYDTKECIWEVEFLLDQTNTYKAIGSLGYANGIKCNSITFGYCYGDLGVTRKLYDLGNAIPNDLRRDWNTAPFQLSGSGTVTKAAITSTSNYNLWVRWPGKWRREFETNLPKNKTLTGTNFPILRYSDVLLMYAEAENEINGATSDAYHAINLVRERAQGTGNRISGFTIENGGSGYTSAPVVTISSPTLGNGATATATVSGGKITGLTLSPVGLGGAFYTSAPDITFSGGGGTGGHAVAVLTPIIPSSADLTPGLTKDEFRSAVQDERGRELCLEALRRPDLIRWDLLLSSLRALANDPNISMATNPVYNYAGLSGRNASDKDLLLPIPISEMTLNASIGSQNPGF